jgi:hypothetical protein
MADLRSHPAKDGRERRGITSRNLLGPNVMHGVVAARSKHLKRLFVDEIAISRNLDSSKESSLKRFDAVVSAVHGCSYLRKTDKPQSESPRDLLTMVMKIRCEYVGGDVGLICFVGILYNVPVIA